MIKTLKMTDISRSEVERIVQSIKFSQTLCYTIEEKDVEVILSCEVNESNKFVFAAVFEELKDFVYTDENESPFDRLCSLVQIRGLKLGVVDQGFRGKLAEKLMSCGCCVKYYLGFDNINDLKSYFGQNEFGDIAKIYANHMGLDVVILGTAEVEGNGLISSLCNIAVYNDGNVVSKKDYFLGTVDDIASKLSFLAAALTDKKIY